MNDSAGGIPAAAVARPYRLHRDGGRYCYFNDRDRRDAAAARLAESHHRTVYTARYVGDPANLALRHGWAVDGHIVPGLGHDDYLTISFEIENRYANYDMVITQVADVRIPAPPPDPDSDAYDDWRREHVYEFTGIGRYDGDSWYDVTVTACSDPALVGETFDFGY